MRTIHLAACLMAPLIVSCTTVLAQTPPPAPAVAATVASPAPTPVARATLRTAQGIEAGNVTAFRGPQGVLLRVEGQGWPAGWHGVHLHAVGRCEGPGFTSAGAHWNHAEARPHGLLNPDGGPDLGDLQNIWAAADGTARAEVYIAGAGPGRAGIELLDADGLSFIVHANADDHVSQPIGGAGGRIACGVFEPAG